MKPAKAALVPACLWLVVALGCAAVPADPSADPEGEPSSGSPDEASAGAPRTGGSARVAEQQIALDFANAIMQIEALAPEDTLLRFARADRGAPVLDALRVMLAEAGYAVQRVAGDGGENTVRYRVDPQADEPDARRHEVSIGEIGLRRVYRDDGGERVRPASALFVRGADPRSIRMVDEELFGIEPPIGTPGETPGPDGDSPTAAPGGLLASYEHLIAGNADVEALRTVAADIGSGGGSGGDGGDGPASGRGRVSLQPVRNVAELGESNFASVIGTRELVVEHVVDFERASDRLDRRDVALIDDVLERFDPATDLIVVTGYSTGGAASVTRNREMAMRRANRVKGALTAVGVPHERVLIEGYWAETSGTEGVPGRAAVMRLSRRVS